MTALLFTLPGGASAQAPGVTVSFTGEMRVIGFVVQNIKDFTNSRGSDFKDSESAYVQRWRLRTAAESADLAARVVWAIEVGDVVWGLGGGASGDEYGSGVNDRTGPPAGGGLGADGVNVKTKHLFLQFDLPFVPGATLLLGAHSILFLQGPTSAFMDDDAFGVQFTWKQDPFDLQLYTAKIDEVAQADADDNDVYVARLAVAVTGDTRFSVEGMIVDQRCFARRTAPVPDTAGSCVSSGFGETFWVGGTAATKIGPVNLDGTVVYGRRQLFSADTQRTVEERGWGAQLGARILAGPVQVWVVGWYTTGDANRTVGTTASAAASPGPGQDFSTSSNTTRLDQNSDKLPVPIKRRSWSSAPLVAEALLGQRTLGSPERGHSLYLDPTGTWGVGGSGIYLLTRTLAVGAGVAFVRATEGNGVFGDHVVEVDAGAQYTYNANLSFQLLGSYLWPATGDAAWALAFRTRFAF